MTIDSGLLFLIVLVLAAAVVAIAFIFRDPR